jgi:hypothetical protein
MTSITSYKYKRDKTLNHFNISDNIVIVETGAFLKSSLSSVDISNSVKEIKRFAFSQTKIQIITIPLNVNKINFGTFEKCLDLSSVIISPNLTYIDEKSFFQTPKLENIDLSNIITIEEFAFSGSGLKNNHYLNKIKFIGREAFKNNSISKILLGKDLITLEKNSFENNNLTNIIFPKNIQTIDTNIFKNNNLDSVNSYVVVPKIIKDNSSFDITNINNKLFVYDPSNYIFQQIENGILKTNVISTFVPINDLIFSGYDFYDLYNNGYTLSNIINNTDLKLHDAIKYINLDSNITVDLKNAGYSVSELFNIGKLTKSQIPNLNVTNGYSLKEIESVFSLQTMFDYGITLRQINNNINDYPVTYILSNIRNITIEKLYDSSFNPYHLYPSYSLNELFSLNFQASDFVNLVTNNNYVSLTDISNSNNYDLSSILQSNFDVNDFHNSGYTARQLNLIGNKQINFFTGSNYSVNNLVDASFTIQDLYDTSIPLIQIKNIYSIQDILNERARTNNNLYSNIEIIQAGYHVSNYFDVSNIFSVLDLKTYGNVSASSIISDTSYSPIDILDALYSPLELKNANFSVEHFHKSNNYFLEDYQDNSFGIINVYNNIEIIVDGSYTLQEYYDGGFSVSQIKNHSNNRFTLTQVIDSSYNQTRADIVNDFNASVLDLSLNGFTLNEIVPPYTLDISMEETYSLEDIYNANFQANEYKTRLVSGNTDYSVSLLKKKGNKPASYFLDTSYSNGEIIDALYSIQELYDSSYSIQFFKDKNTNFIFPGATYKLKDLSNNVSIQYSYPIQDILNAGFHASLYYDASYTTYQLNTIGDISINTLLQDTSYTFLEILDGSYSVLDLYNSDFHISEFKFQPDTNYSIQDLSGIYDISNILNAGFSMNTYKLGNYTIGQLRTIGDISLSNFINTNGSLNSNYTYIDILDGSYSVIDLYSNNFPANQFIFKPENNSIYSINDLSNVYDISSIINAGYKINSYYDGSYNVNQLRTIGDLSLINFINISGELDSSYTYLDVLDGSYSVLDLYNNYFPIEQFKFKPNTNYSIKDLSGIYDISRILQANFNINTYYDGSYTTFELNTIGNYDVSNILNTNYSISEILDGSYNIQELYNNNISPNNFSNSVYDIPILLDSSYNRTQIIQVGYNINHYYDNSFSARELKEIGNYPVSFFIDTSYSTQDIFNLNYSVNDLSINGLLTQDNIDEYAIATIEPGGTLNYSVYDISGLFSVDLLLRGYSYQMLINNGFTNINLDIYTPNQLKNELNIPANALKETGYSINTPNLHKDSNGIIQYTIQELKEGGFTNTDFINSLYNSTNPNQIISRSFSLLDLSNSFRYVDLGQVTINGSSYKYNGTGNGIPLGFFKSYNYDVSYLTNGGIYLTDINNANFADNLFQLYYTAQDLYDGGFSIVSLSKAGGIISGPKYQYTLQEVMSINPPLDELKIALVDLNGYNGTTRLGNSPSYDISVNTLKTFNYPLNDVYSLRNFGFEDDEYGYSIQQLSNAGYSIQDFYDNNYTLTIAMLDSYSIESILQSGYSIDQINSLQSAVISPGDLLGLGATICDLNVFLTPNRTWSRYRPPSIDLSNYSVEDYNMRRKVEILQYRKNANDYTSDSNIKNVLKGQNNCPIGTKPTSTRNSDVPGETMNLVLNPNVPVINFLKKI